jgi:hypothetical protein
MDRFYRTIRRRRAGLCDARDRRRAETTDFLSGKRTADAALGLRQSSDGLDKRRQSIVFRSQRDSWTLPHQPSLHVPMTGGAPVALPMPEAGSGDFSPDGTKMVYSPRTRDFRTEKRYGGGQANTLYIYDLNTNDARKISEGVRASRDAMWIGD